MESNLPVLQSYTRYVAKDTAFVAEYDDAFHVGLQSGRAAIADGVGSAIFSGRWARILVKKAVEDPPDLRQPDAWVKWLEEPRRLWLIDVDFPRMPANQKNKLRQTGGSFCTLCWIQVDPLSNSDDGTNRCTLRAHAMGDSCVLQIRSGQLLTSFPLSNSAEFDLDPDSVCSVASSRDTHQPVRSTEFECLENDVIVMVTDAICKWMFDTLEKGARAPWEQLWTLDEAGWIDAIGQLRDSNAMKRDDTTMVAIHIGGGTPAWLNQMPHKVETDFVPASPGECDEVIAAPDQEGAPLVTFAESAGDDDVPATSACTVIPHEHYTSEVLPDGLSEVCDEASVPVSRAEASVVGESDSPPGA